MPHSEIPGSPIARISPGLFAACHVLHRLSVPRHPPDALASRLITGIPVAGNAVQPPRTGPNPRGTNPDGLDRPPSAQFQAPALLAPSRPAKLRFARRQPRTQSAAQHGLRRSRPRMKTLLRTHRRGGQHLAAPAKTVGRVRLGHITTLSSPVNQQTRRGRRGGRCLRQTLLSAPRRRTRRPAKPCFAGGGGERIRTDDLLLAKQALSQLSYTPSQEGRAPARSPTPAPDP